MIHVVLITRMLNVGGAQRQMIEIARNMDKDRFSLTIVTLYAGGLLDNEMRAIKGVEVVALDKRGRYDILGSASRFLRICKSRRIQVICTWSGGTEYALLARLLCRCRILFGIRHSSLDLSKYSRSLGFFLRLTAKLSFFIDIFVSNSWAGRDYFGKLGVPIQQIFVVPNGFDTNRFCPQPESGLSVRTAWGITTTDILVGLVGRFDPQKDHLTFFRAVEILSKTESKMRFVCVGEGVPEYEAVLREKLVEMSLQDTIIWAGKRSDMPEVYCAFDILVLCSAFGEGTPNAVGEGMACGTPYVVTDAGDSGRLLDDASRTVPVGDAEALANAIARLAALTTEARREIGTRDRARIVNHYSLPLLTARTACLIEGVAQKDRLETIEGNLRSLDPS